MKRYILTHNGYQMDFFNTLKEVEEHISTTLEEHKDLRPKEIYRGYNVNNNQATNISETGTIKSVVIYQYYTLYTEVFMIQEQDI